MYKTLHTDRLTIRPISKEDRAFILQIVNSEGWLQYIGDRNIRNEADAEQYIQRILDNERYFYHVFELKDVKEPIGLVTFLHRDTQQYPDIGFALLPAYEKQGYTYEAAKKYLEEVKKDGTCSQIIGITLPDNIKSIKLLEKLGLSFQNRFLQDKEELSLYALSL